MNRRLLLAVGMVALLATMAGCTTIFGGISDETLDREQEYDDLRERDADVAIDVETGEYRAVYDLNGTASLSMSESQLTRDVAIDIEAVRYWYPNGTELTGSEIDVDQSRSSTDVSVPDGNGSLAFTGNSGRRTFSLPSFMSGSYDVTLPEGFRTDNLLFGNVDPGGYERTIEGDQERLFWEDTGSSLSIRFFLSRDITLFVGLVAAVSLLGGLGIAYYYRQVKRLERRRKEMGLDVESDDDSGGPPPGLR